MAEVTNPNPDTIHTVQTGLIGPGATVTIPDEVAATLPDAGVLHVVFDDIKNDWRVAVESVEDDAKKAAASVEAEAKKVVAEVKDVVTPAPAATITPATPPAS